MIITRTPFRISFFGGGTDYPAWAREHGGEVLATTIDKYCYISCRRLPPFFEHKHRIVYSVIENVHAIEEIRHPAVHAVFAFKGVEDGLEVHHDGDLPARSGLGSSSSFTVGLLHALEALDGRIISKAQLAADAIHVEQDLIGETVGSQDQISAAYGGFNRIEFPPDGGFTVEPLIVREARKAELHAHLMLCFTGLSRIASEVAKAQISNMPRREAELHAMRAMVGEAIAILRDERRPIEDFGRLLDEGWRLKRTLSSAVSTPMVDAMYEAACAAGALGGKLLGAGGGGFLLLFVPPARRHAVQESLKNAVHVPFRFENAGSRVVMYEPTDFHD